MPDGYCGKMQKIQIIERLKVAHEFLSQVQTS